MAYTEDDPVALAKTLTTFMKNAPTLQIKAAVVQGQAIKPAQVTDLANMPGKPELYAKLLYRAAGADGQPGARAQRRAARPDERAGAGEEKQKRRARAKPRRQSYGAESAD